MTEYFRVLKKRPDVNFESKTWQAKGVIKSQRQKWVGMFQSQCHPVAYPFPYIPLTHVPLPLSYGTPGQLSLTLDPDHHSGYDSMPCFAYNHRATMIISLFHLESDLISPMFSFLPKSPQLSKNKTPSLYLGQPSPAWCIPNISVWSPNTAPLFLSFMFPKSGLEEKMQQRHLLSTTQLTSSFLCLEGMISILKITLNSREWQVREGVDDCKSLAPIHVFWPPIQRGRTIFIVNDRWNKLIKCQSPDE